MAPLVEGPGLIDPNIPPAAHSHLRPESHLSDTTSDSSEVAALGPLETTDQTDVFPDLPSFPNTGTWSTRSSPITPKQSHSASRTGRSLSLAQIAGPVKRKPLSATASPLATRHSTPAAYPDDPLLLLQDLESPEHRFARAISLDSPTLYDFPGHRKPIIAPTSLHTLHQAVAVVSPEPTESSQLSSPVFEPSAQPVVPAAGAQDVQLRNSPAVAQTPHTPLEEEDDLSAETASQTTEESYYDHLDFVRADSPESVGDRTTVLNINTKTMSMLSRKSPPPHLNLGTSPIEQDIQQYSPATHSRDSTNLNKPLPKSPASSKLGVFFGWGNSSPSPSSQTEFSEGAFSPLPASPSSFKPATLATESYETPVSPGSPTYSNDAGDRSPGLYYSESRLQTRSESSASLVEIEEMEDELKAISAELAASIRREMDLEDLVDRMQDQVNNPQAPGKRSSDYFSDSGYSSARFSEYDHAKDEISQIQRRAEQEKAKVRLELTSKLQEEREMRRALDLQIQELQLKASQVDHVQLDNSAASERVKELEAICEDLSRRLQEEKEVKNNFEDLLNVLKGELQTAANERDNLRDEIVPQLRARVEGLEAEAAENAKLAYDTSKMQQELESLKSQNTELQQSEAEKARLAQELESLRSQNSELKQSESEKARLAYDASRLQQELDSLRSENSELKQTGNRMSMALSRSASVTGGSFKRGLQSRPQSLSRSNSTRPGPASTEPREVLAERLKDVEAQRDALHSALKSLLERQEHQNRENDKRIRQLEMERDRLLTASPKKAGYERDVSKLRDEINVLRRRAEEAIDQKWQVEKGLGGLKMDLDRAEEEIAMLRGLLKEADILIPDSLPHADDSDDTAIVSSASLEKAYKDLQAAYTEALERIKALEESASADERTRLAIQRLEHSLAIAVSDRDMARAEVEAYRAQLESLKDTEKQQLDAEADLADQLQDSARRIEELSQQVRSQLDANAALRTRLAMTIARGEAESRVSTERIASMQKRLRTLEEQVVNAQTGAEERVARYEEELASLKEAHSIQLQRLRDTSGGLRSPRHFPSNSPLSPMFSIKSGQQNSARSVRLSSPLLSPNGPSLRRSVTSPLDETTNTLSQQVETLKGRVAELEGALATADAEMQEVVGRMNTAQIEVMTLQEEREAAVRQTRKLQRIIEDEKMRVFQERFKSISS
ncbi:hypothetical protein QBC38DRAFT_522300 [Podospora fimiseda]|uniref:DUF7603 domain-containing protein n=1 Tax=Podospora fimiseda TaxID=252190 RepID=A0AAN7BT79_9PEZI|nr:hypothetical protein QBC38DRAFT_522300 [Podospora fimiseda]